MPDDIEEQIRKNIERRLQALKGAAMERAQDLVTERLSSLKYRQMFVSGLKIDDQEDGSFKLDIDNEVRFLEDGYGPYDMLTSLLARPSAKTNKKGEKYVIVPISEEVKGSDAQGRELNKLFRNRKSDRIMQELNAPSNQVTDRLKNLRGISDVKGIDSPNLLAGDLASIDRIREYNTNIQDRASLRGLKPMNISFVGTKFRTAKASDAGTGKWQHPGYGGAHILLEVNDWIKDQINKMNQ